MTQQITLPAGTLPYRPSVLSPHTPGFIIEDVWPTIFFGEEAMVEIRRKATRLP